MMKSYDYLISKSSENISPCSGKNKLWNISFQIMLKIVLLWNPGITKDNIAVIQKKIQELI